MSSNQEVVALQRAADQFVVRRSVRGSGIGATIFGALALFAAVLPPASPVLLGLGALLAVVGLWNLTNPRPLGILLIGVCLVAVGAFNIASGFIEAAGGHAPFVGWQVLGFWQIVWGIQSVQRHRRFANAFAEAVSEAQMRWAKGMLDALRKASPKKESDVVEFAASSALQPRLVKLRLLPEGALCMVNNGDDVRVVPREAVAIEPTGKKVLGGGLKAKVRLGELALEGTLMPTALERYQQWRGVAAQPQPMAKAA